MDLHYQKYSDKGHPLLVLHGLFGNLSNWKWHCQQLSEHFQVFGLDLRNHGQSPHDDEMSYPTMAADVKAFLDAQQIDSCHLIGHSMGGKVAMELALSAPERIDKLVVADIAPVNYSSAESGHDKVFSGMAAINLAILKSRSEAESILEGFVDDKKTRLFIVANLYKTPAGKFDWRLNLSALNANYPSLKENVQAVGEFNKAVLFIKGGDSGYINASFEPDILARFPQAKVMTIMGAGHWVHAEKPQVFQSIASRFLLETFD